MPQDDPAPIEGGALQFFATEFGAIVNSFAEHGFRDPPLRISIAVREMLAERALVHDRLDAANRMDQTVTELTQALAGCRTALRETEIALGEAKAEVLSLSVAAGEANSMRAELRDLRTAFENMAVREKKAIDRADRANDRAIAALAPSADQEWSTDLSAMPSDELFLVQLEAGGVFAVRKSAPEGITRLFYQSAVGFPLARVPVTHGVRCWRRMPQPSGAAVQQQPRVMLIGGTKARAVAHILLSGAGTHTGPAITHATGMEQAIDFARHRGPFTIAAVIEGDTTDEQIKALTDSIPRSFLMTPLWSIAQVAEWIVEQLPRQPTQPAPAPINSPEAPKNLSDQ